MKSQKSKKANVLICAQTQDVNDRGRFTLSNWWGENLEPAAWERQSAFKLNLGSDVPSRLSEIVVEERDTITRSQIFGSQKRR